MVINFTKVLRLLDYGFVFTEQNCLFENESVRGHSIVLDTEL